MSILRLGISSLGVAGGQSYHDGIGLNFGTGVYYRKPTGGVVSRGSLTDLFTFTGGNQSMYMGGAGLLVQSVTNTPRIEYDASGNCLGLLMEAARTNLALHSNDMTNAAWANVTTTTAKTSTGPDGVANSATRLTATGANSTRLQTVTSASATRAYSVWMKRITGTGNIQMTVDNGGTWTTKTLTTSWARFDISQAAVTNPVFGIRIVTSADAIDVYGNQLESAAFPSSLITTGAAGVARTADSCIRTLSTEFSATVGTVSIAGRASGGQDATTGQFVYNFDDGTLDNRLGLLRPGVSDVARVNITAATVSQLTGVDATFANSTSYKAGIAWAANDVAMSFNGAVVLTDTSATIPTLTPTLLQLGAGASSGQGNGHILRFDYFPTRLPNTFLVSAST